MGQQPPPYNQQPPSGPSQQPPQPPPGYSPGQPPQSRPGGPPQGGPPQYYQPQTPQGPPPIGPNWVTTAFSLPGVRITRNIGLVRGVTVRSRSVVGNLGAAFQQIAGGNITVFTELAEASRQEAYDIMIQHAAQLGGNAVIGMRYDATEITQGVTEVIAYGTAVVIEAQS